MADSAAESVLGHDAAERPAHLAAIVESSDDAIIGDRTAVRRRLEILARAGEVLASSLDPAETLDQVAGLLVPELADWCIVRLAEAAGQPSLRRVAVAHPDPRRIRQAQGLAARLFAPSGIPSSARRVLSTGRAELYQIDVAPDRPAADGAYDRFLRSLGIRSALILPLVARDQILGTLTLATEGRAFSDEDGHLAREVARRCALAVDNARAYAIAQVEIAERGRIAAELRTSNERLAAALAELRRTQRQVVQQERLRALGQMASGIAHNLNQSLALISGYGELAQRELDAASPDLSEIRSMLATMSQAAFDGGATIRRLLTFARNQAAEVTESIDVAALLPEVARLTAPSWRDAAQAQGRPIGLSVDTEGGAHILGSAAGLREALTNLIINAVDALPAGGTIRLAARVRDRQVVIEVADTGVGIPPDALEQIFEPFFTSKGERGTGLGLAQVQGIVARHGGEIDVRSAVGAGTTFRLTFPRAEAVAALRPARVEEPPRPAPRPLRILVVDDEKPVAEMIVRALEPDGHAIDLAPSAEEALARLASGPYDLLISDVGLGAGPNGWDLCARARERWPGLPIILATGWGAAIDGEDARERGIAAVLAKPYRLRELREAVAACGRVKSEE